MICIFSYCCLYFYLPYLLLNIYDGNDAFWRQSTCSSNSSAPLAGNTGFYLSRSVSAKQSGWPGNPVDYRIWRLMQECVYIVQDTCPRLLDAAHIIFESVVTLFTKNYQNSSMFVETSACQKFGAFFETQCSLCLYLVPFLRHSASNNSVTLKFRLRVVQGRVLY